MKRWYVVQIYTGFEEVVKADLEKRIIEENLQDLFGEILVPRGQVVSMISGEQDKKEKIFPGYLLIQLEMTGESYKVVASNPRVTRFLGGEKPVPISDKEVSRIFSQISGELPVARETITFMEGNEVNISSGPFAGFVGVVEKIDEEREKLTVMVSIFGRLTPVELGFDQVKR
ncbi:MAG: Transcription antitermination protein nusG [candidate division TM6 bacterium GW2011_GWF2_28_16]|jgi:transcriptional antiterminator NusG|nr:MAG: Transcription antitermination protein nusG [candidate division TM6 bacterium GW2011_GWF2_28_16]